MSIALTSSLGSFFDEAVHDALKVRNVEATEAAKHYLVGLLSDFAHPDPLAEDTLGRPFTFLLDEALNAAGVERFHRLRTLGDGVLYVTGFFRDHIENRGVSVRYVVSVGTIAYENVSAMFRAREGEDVFRELAQKLPRFVEVLTEVAERAQAQQARGEKGLVKLYERWLRTGSSRLAAELGARGIVPLKGPGGTH